jgi:hypothetical protein
MSQLRRKATYDHLLAVPEPRDAWPARGKMEQGGVSFGKRHGHREPFDPISIALARWWGEA